MQHVNRMSRNRYRHTDKKLLNKCYLLNLLNKFFLLNILNKF